ncbi:MULTISPECIES: adenylate/guanylate cyclase domain-containing protein [Rhodomicrobium]|uniref:ATP-binding protein n=1 Tax=Rhodomicrobium TaxID=1068 RepID=UPI000B4AF0C5|nr:MULTISPECIES: adenylate/guanylate cyclase domain-containing protein [Rhodomicrobium]
MVEASSRSEIAARAGDRQIVTILFADVVSSTKLTANLDPDDIRELMDHATAVMASAVRSYDGAVVRFQGDGIEAVFGAPRPAEDHAVRACLAGLAIQKAFAANALSGLPPGASPKDLLRAQLKVRVGIHSGLVIAREVNSDLGGGLDMLGATVSLAALAEKICPAGAVTATEATADLAGAFLEARPFNAAGHELSSQYNFVEVLGVNLSAPALARDLFVGRIDEQQMLLRALDEAAQRGRIVALVGDPGIGKSRLSSEIARSAAARQIPHHQIRGLSLMQATPYAPIPAFLGALLGIADRRDGQSAARAAANLGLTDTETAGLIELLAMQSEPRASRIAADGQEHSDVLQEAFSAVVAKAWGQAPALLVIDDIQLLDAETVACLRRLARQIGDSRAFILVNGRPESRDIMRRMTAEFIDLRPLGKDHLLELVASLAPHIAEDGELANRVAERSGGVPFVLEQILRAMSRQGASFDDRILPTNVESIILARLNRLSGEAKHFAQLASVLGEESDYPLLRCAAAPSLGDPERCVKELVEAGFFVPVAADTVRFKHALIRDACLDSIVRPERQRLHARMLDCFQEQYASLSPYFEQLAYHAEGAGRDDLAVEYLWSASKNAARNSAVHSLEILLERAMACCQRLGAAGEKREVDFVLLAFDALQQHGKLMSVVPRLGRTADLAAQQGRKDKECLARAHLATVLWFQAQHHDGRKLAERAVDLAREIGALPALLHTQFTLANLRIGCGDIPGAIALLRANIELLSGDLERASLGAVGLPSVMSRSFLGWYLTDQGRLSEAAETIERAVAVADAVGRPYPRVLAHLSRGRMLYERGDYGGAVDRLTEVRDWCWQHRIYAMEPAVTGLLASALCRTGAASAALAATEASIAKEFYRGAARMACFYLFAGHGEALVGCGQPERGAAVIAKAVRETETPYDPCLCVPGHILAGQISCAAGDFERARPEFGRALSVALAIGMVPGAARAYEGLAECSREAETHLFRQNAEAAARLYRQCEMAVPPALC